ncbi:hypothetical protein Q428_02335 [Fervidicella metallireducens AeB]|uniref:DUF11 domain-containing protein n=1 Tax=Fervidicella metallireducens AeB TaxID=1403537 RepID=A0A017RZZ2_9CLOT|nr:DUF11 domain-containing protein [Fervidicella metallireducens]EYE89490.1 hypothetical protein Q428_02335 [Fervidicella metallireducens AeB]
MPNSPFFVMTVDKTENIPLLLGGRKSISVRIQNLSPDKRLYNLMLTLNLPDGIEFDSADIAPTSKLIDSNGISRIKWVNIKDFTPLEIDYVFTFTLRSSLTFKNGSNVLFGYLFSGIALNAEVDTMPRGNIDIGNEKYQAENLLSFKTARFSAKINLPAKALKGAGTGINLNDYTQTYTAKFTINNNLTSKTMTDVTIILDDGLRIIGEVTANGTDALKFLTPTVDIIYIEDKRYTRLTYKNVLLSIGSETFIYINFGVWNRYNNNTGLIINHGTTLNTQIKIEGENELIEENAYTKAMDIIIEKSVSQRITDVGQKVDFTINCKTGQYYTFSDIKILEKLPDGLSYSDSSKEPYSITVEPQIKGTLIIYNIGNKPVNFSETIVLKAIVNKYYRFKTKDGNTVEVAASDSFYNKIDLEGFNDELEIKNNDSSSCSLTISEPNAKKIFLNAYYRDGTKKNINVLAPNDLAEFQLEYDATTTDAVQDDICIDDYFPLSVDPIADIEYTFEGYMPPGIQPLLIEPHGVRFNYGKIPGNSKSIIKFRASVAGVGISEENINLLKIKGINTDGYSYSKRDQIQIKTGAPNLILTKTVSGPNKNAIKSGETYVFTITLTNTNTLGTETDAFSFQLKDEISNYFILDSGSVKLSGTGEFAQIEIYDTEIKLPILKLSPGQYAAINYSVKIKEGIAPNVSISTTASNTNPYSQLYNPALSNYQYSGLNKSAAVTIKTANITMNKTTNTENIRVGSEVRYQINISVPQGTKAYNLNLKDILPTGQVYIGPATKDGIEITPTVIGNNIFFPEETIVDALTVQKNIVYVFNAKIEDVNKNVGSTTSTQVNTSTLTWRTEAGGGSIKTLSRNLTVTVNHPNIVISLSGKEWGERFYTGIINTYSDREIRLRCEFTNNSSVKLIDGILEILIDEKYIFKSIDVTWACNAYFDNVNRKIIITIQELKSGVSGFVEFTLRTISDLRAGTEILTVTNAAKYRNDISPKIYSGEYSNIFAANLPPGVTLLPFITDRIDDSTSVRVTPVGSTATIINNLINSGNGIDDYKLTIEKSEIDYSLFIDREKIQEVSKNTKVSIEPDELKNVKRLEMKQIIITAFIPFDTPLNKVFRFIVNVKSKTIPIQKKQ